MKKIKEKKKKKEIERITENLDCVTLKQKRKFLEIVCWVYEVRDMVLDKCILDNFIKGVKNNYDREYEKENG